jgi:CubicO group peptidase (beta-lactamase class C family)
MLSLLLRATLLSISLLLAGVLSALSAELTEQQLDGFVEKAMNVFDIPGIAVGIIKEGEIKHLKGYGVREIGNDAPVDGDTLYAIASNSKAFTAAALAILVDDGVLQWDDKVIDFLPNFRLQDPWVTREFTIRDLLTHRSGMGLGAGDLMFWPSTFVTREEIIENVRHLKMVSGFRTEYAYDNLLYVVAGEVIAAASGMRYEEFVDSRIMNQLAIGNGCFADTRDLVGADNIAEPHVIVDGEILKAHRLQPLSEPMVIAAAGGIQCSARAMMSWVKMHLNDGAGLMSKSQHDEMWTSQTILPVSNSDKAWHNTNFSAYGLGFRLKDYHGYKHVSHTGGLLGMVTYTVMIPQKKLGVIVFTNQENGSAMRAIMENIMQTYLDTGNVDWTDRLNEIRLRSIENAASQVDADAADANASALLPLIDYMGTFRDPWFGDVEITMKEDGLYFTSLRSEKLRGKMYPFKFNTFRVIWDDRSFNADAYAMFETDFDGKVNGLKMKAISPLTDFSYDFHDLNFARIKSD